MNVSTEPLRLELTALEKDLQALGQQIDKTAQALNTAFDSTEIPDQTVDLSRYIDKFSGQLLYLRLNLGRLKGSISDAAAPLGSVLLPLVNRAIYGLSRMADSVGAVLAGVMDGILGTDALTDSTEKAAQAESALSRSAKAARRSLAGFDELQRLNAPTGGSAASAATSSAPQTATLDPAMQATVQKLLDLLAPLRAIDFTPLEQALERLGTSFRSVWQGIGSVLEWAWLELLAPLCTWVAEQFAPALSGALSGAFTAVSAVLAPLLTGIDALWKALEPVTAFIGQVAVAALEGLEQSFQNLAAVFTGHGPQLAGVFRNVGQAVTALWQTAQPILGALLEQWSSTFSSISAITSKIAGFVLDALYGITEHLCGSFTGDWKRSWEGLKFTVKAMVNGIISLLNAMLSGITGALNGVIRMANSLQFTLPDWLGGQSFGFSFKTVKTPQIPYLAQGAVLPANKPFLAVVGDQRHGTNIEAPLGVIEEAVQRVTASQSAAVAAALEASTGVQREILSAVLGIRIGDDTVAHAVERYQRKMAIVQGTPY